MSLRSNLSNATTSSRHKIFPILYLRTEINAGRRSDPEALNRTGASLVADGDFGSRTEAAIRNSRAIAVSGLMAGSARVSSTRLVANDTRNSSR